MTRYMDVNGENQRKFRHISSRYDTHTVDRIRSCYADPYSGKNWDCNNCGNHCVEITDFAQNREEENRSRLNALELTTNMSLDDAYLVGYRAGKRDALDAIINDIQNNPKYRD